MHKDIYCSMCGKHTDECECERVGLTSYQTGEKGSGFRKRWFLRMTDSQQESGGLPTAAIVDNPNSAEYENCLKIPVASKDMW